jgi:hypothetical protein
VNGIGHNKPPLGEGWIARHRSVRDHWLVGHGIHVKPADPTCKLCSTQGEAWEDLLMECRYEDGTVSNGGKKMELRRGELVGAVSWLANRWNWTPKTVRRFLDQLEIDGMITLRNPASEKGNQIGRQANVITVCNYDTYQNGYVAQEKPKGQPEGHQRATTGRPEGNIYKDNKGTREQGNNTQAQSAPGVLVVNCETISHPNFVIDLQAVFQGAMLIGVPQDEAKAVAEIMAKDWIASNYKPAKPARYVIDELRKIANGKAIQGVRVDRASGKTPGKRMTLEELSDNVDAAYDRQFFGQPKTPRLTHER